MKACAAFPVPFSPAWAPAARRWASSPAAANWRAICCGWLRAGWRKKPAPIGLIAVSGYVLQMAAVPALALAGSWQAAALFIVLERSGKAVRNPAANLMLSRAGAHIGQGWAFGLHEAMDQTGACGGPTDRRAGIGASRRLPHSLSVAGHTGGADGADGTQRASCALALPGNVAKPPRADRRQTCPAPSGFMPRPRRWWAFGFVDYPLIAFHFARTQNRRARAGFPSSMRWPCWHRAQARYCSAAGSTGAGLVVLVPGLVIGSASRAAGLLWRLPPGAGRGAAVGHRPGRA